jgi:hypothetical protein
MKSIEFSTSAPCRFTVCPLRARIHIDKESKKEQHPARSAYTYKHVQSAPTPTLVSVSILDRYMIYNALHTRIRRYMDDWCAAYRAWHIYVFIIISCYIFAQTSSVKDVFALGR